MKSHGEEFVQMSYALEYIGLSQRVGKTVAINNMNLRLEEGRVIGLLGPRNSGTATLLKLAGGLLSPTAGEVRVLNQIPGIETKRKVAYLPERLVLPPWMTVKQAIRYFQDFFEDFNLAKAEAICAKLKINQTARIKSLRKGVRRNVQLMLTLAREAELYLLEEPFGGEEPQVILDLILAHYQKEATLVIATHQVKEVQAVLEEVVFLKKGKVILQKTKDEIVEQNSSIDALYWEVLEC